MVKKLFQDIEEFRNEHYDEAKTLLEKALEETKVDTVGYYSYSKREKQL